MAATRDDEPAGAAAWAEFYTRHSRYLFAVLYQAHGKQLGNARVLELVHDTFIRAFEKAATFRPDGAAGNTDAGRRQVRAWIGQIAENMLRDSFRRDPQVVFMEEEEIEAKHDRSSEGSEVEPPSVGALRLEKALAQLTEREQEVMRVTGFWYQGGQRKQRLPNSVMSQLAADLNTTPDNIRQIRARATKRLREMMEAE